jgi:hypothetical protein
MTPACDYYQGRLKVARLVAGFLVPAARTKEVKNADSFKRLPTMSLSAVGLAGDWIMILNGRHVVSASASVLTREIALFRLRDSLVTDARSWFAAHGMRAGILQL